MAAVGPAGRGRPGELTHQQRWRRRAVLQPGSGEAWRGAWPARRPARSGRGREAGGAVHPSSRGEGGPRGGGNSAALRGAAGRRCRSERAVGRTAAALSYLDGHRCPPSEEIPPPHVHGGGGQAMEPVARGGWDVSVPGGVQWPSGRSPEHPAVAA